MASYNELIALIDAFIKRNGVQAITGQILNGVLKAMVDQVGRGYAIMGVATPSTNPGTPDAPESWFASTPGTYTNFGGLEVADAEFALLSYTPSGEVWTKTTLTEGIQEVSASIDGNVGTPEVTAEYINGGLIFTFSNMKGQTGDAAGFGTVNATVDGNIGTPGVSVNTSGPDTAKNITFAFRNLKGETGVTSVVATVDNTTGSPSCSVSLVGQELHLDFHGLKGAQGDTGSSVDYPFTIVNNLTTDDPTQALSAAQGVVLQGELSQLEAKVIEGITRETTEFTDTGKFLYGTGTLDSAAYNVTDYINIEGAKRIVLTNVWEATNGILSYVIYDENKSILEKNPTPSTTGNKNYDLTDIPANAKYIRCSQNNSYSSSVKVYLPGIADCIKETEDAKKDFLDLEEDVTLAIEGGQKRVNIYALFSFVIGGGYYGGQTIGNTFTGALAATSNGDYAPGVDVSNYDGVSVQSNESTGTRAVVLTDENDKVVFSGIWSDYSSEHTMSINVKSLGGKYLYISKNAGASLSVEGINNILGIQPQIDSISGRVGEFEDTVNGETQAVQLSESSGYMYLQNGTLYAAANSLYQDIDLSSYAGKTVIIKITDVFVSSTRYTGIAVNGAFVKSFCEKDYTEQIEWIIPDNAHLLESHSSFSTIEVSIYSEGIVERIETLAKNTAFVSPSGDDTNDGTSNSPLLTINKALDMGAELVLLDDGVYEQQIDLSLAKKGCIRIQRATPGDIPIIKAPGAILVNDGTETLESGTTKVFKKSINASFDSSLLWIYQEGVSDVNTLIADAERHPLQRGEEYRCENTLIIRTTSNIVTDAISEIENYDGYKWFFDSDNSILYFSRPDTTSQSKALCKGTNKELFLNIPAGIKVDMSGVGVWYQKANFHNMFQPHISDCSAKYINGDCFGWNNTVGAVFERCEAARSQNGVNGDGFNAHSTYSQNVNVFAKYTTARLIDCWSHDCMDDGYSDHERCEITIYGGLFEYCGKAGITPSYGTHCCCYGVISRRNYRGFYLCGYEAAEGGKYGQLLCVSCLAENNYYTENDGGTGFHSTSTGNKVICVNCKSRNNRIGYRTDGNGATMELTDCGSYQDGTMLSRGGTITIKNTTIVSD